MNCLCNNINLCNEIIAYADTIKKPNFKMSTVHENAFEEDRLHEASPQAHLLVRQTSKMFEH